MERILKRIHPGLILRMEFVEGRNLSVSKIAELLDTTRANMSKILNGNASISPNMALRIATVFGSTATHFMQLQSSYDLAVAKAFFLENPPKIKKFEFA